MSLGRIKVLGAIEEAYNQLNPTQQIYANHRVKSAVQHSSPSNDEPSSVDSQDKIKGILDAGKDATSNTHNLCSEYYSNMLSYTTDEDFSLETTESVPI